MAGEDEAARPNADLGEDRPIPRRDFLQGALVGAASALCGPLLRAHAEDLPPQATSVVDSSEFQSIREKVNPATGSRRYDFPPTLRRPYER